MSTWSSWRLLGSRSSSFSHSSSHGAVAGQKVSRALVAAARLEGGTVYWPATAPWLDEWENELLLFPNSRHDDQVDTLAYAAIELAKRSSIDHGAIAEAIGRANASLYRPSPNHP